MAMMLDIDYLTAPRSFGSLLVYRYKTGVLRAHMKACVEALGANIGLQVFDLDILSLASHWQGNSLFEGIGFYDIKAKLNPREVEAASRLLTSTPGMPAVIFVSNAVAIDLPLTCTGKIIEEVVVRPSNLLRALKYLATTSDLSVSHDLVNQDAFYSYFDVWIRNAGEKSLIDLMQEFDRSVLLFHDQVSGQFENDDEQDPERPAPSFLVRAVHQFLESARPFESAELLRCLERRRLRGLDQKQLLRDLCVATARVVSRRRRQRGVRMGATTSSDAARRSDLALLLWCALVVNLDHRMATTRQADESRTLIEFDNLCREFSQRIDLQGSDMMIGIWSELHECVVLDPTGRSKHINDILDVMRGLAASGAERGWPAKVCRLLTETARTSGGDQIKIVPSEVISNALLPSELFSAPKVLQALKSRFINDRHVTPLTIVGPEGSGKTTLARLYASALLCEHKDIHQPTACDACSRQDALERNAGFVELDLGVEQASRNVMQVLGALNYVPLLSHCRVVVLTNTQHSLREIDAFLKTFENTAYRTTFIVLGCDEREMRSTILSRSEVWRLKPLPYDEARALASRELRGQNLSMDVIDLIVLHAGYLPGLVVRFCRLLQREAISTLTGAKSILGVGWGQEALEYMNGLLGQRELTADQLAPFSGVEVSESLRRVRIVLGHLRSAQAVSEAALVGLDDALKQCQLSVSRRAKKCKLSVEQMWDELTQHWELDDIVDVESFIKAGVHTQNICRGKANRSRPM